jgi:hypothetical protein
MNSISKWTSLIASACLHCRFNAAAKFYVSIKVTKCSHKIKESQHSLEKLVIQENLQPKLTSGTIPCQHVSVSQCHFQMNAAQFWYMGSSNFAKNLHNCDQNVISKLNFCKFVQVNNTFKCQTTSLPILMCKHGDSDERKCGESWSI